MDAISTCGLWSDPVDVALQSAEYLKKWEYKEPLEDDTEDGDVPQTQDDESDGGDAE